MKNKNLISIIILIVIVYSCGTNKTIPVEKIDFKLSSTTINEGNSIKISWNVPKGTTVTITDLGRNLATSGAVSIAQKL